MRVAVIGAGPSGLVTLKYLLAAERALGTAPIEARLFESEAGVGGTFLTRMYEDAEVSRYFPRTPPPTAFERERHFCLVRILTREATASILKAAYQLLRLPR